MGCFGYICKECGEAIRGDAHSGGEKCVLIHVRHGKEVGRVEGHYNEYGSVIEHDNLDENIKYRGDGESNPNSHYEILKSEMHLKDSYDKLSIFRIYDGDWVDFNLFCSKRTKEELIKADYDMYSIVYHEVILSRAISDRKFSDKLNEYNACYKKYKYVDRTEEEKKITTDVLDGLAYVMFDMLRNDFYDLKDKFVRGVWDNLTRVEFSDGYSGTVAYHSCCYRRAMRNKTFNLIPSEFDPNQSWGKIRKKYCK